VESASRGCGSLRVDGGVVGVCVGACAGAESAESDGEEEAAAAESDGAQVPAEDAEERVHSVALSFRVSCLVVGCVLGSGSGTVAKGLFFFFYNPVYSLSAML
jgi:hypothetical protein